MKLQNISKKIFGAAFSLALLLSLGFVSTETANAQWQRSNDQWRRDQDRDYQRRDRNDRDRDRDRDDRRGNNRRRGNDGYPNMGGSFDLRQTALNAGYNKGRDAGRNDRKDRDRYDFRDEGDYRNASKDYNSRLGNKSLYQQYFRLAFENGYADGYEGY